MPASCENAIKSEFDLKVMQFLKSRGIEVELKFASQSFAQIHGRNNEDLSLVCKN